MPVDVNALRVGDLIAVDMRNVWFSGLNRRSNVNNGFAIFLSYAPAGDCNGTGNQDPIGSARYWFWTTGVFPGGHRVVYATPRTSAWEACITHGELIASAT